MSSTADNGPSELTDGCVEVLACTKEQRCRAIWGGLGPRGAATGWAHARSRGVLFHARIQDKAEMIASGHALGHGLGISANESKKDRPCDRGVVECQVRHPPERVATQRKPAHVLQASRDHRRARAGWRPVTQQTREEVRGRGSHHARHKSRSACICPSAATRGVCRALGVEFPTVRDVRRRVVVVCGAHRRYIDEIGIDENDLGKCAVTRPGGETILFVVEEDD